MEGRNGSIWSSRNRSFPTRKMTCRRLRELNEFCEKQARIARIKLAITEDLISENRAIHMHPVLGTCWKADEQVQRVRSDLKEGIKELEQDKGVAETAAAVRSLCRPS